MHFPERWPPSDNLIPLLISFHIDQSDKVWKMFTPKGIEFFKKHEPVGCRDYDTMRLLQKYHIDCYFSGCLTLTLGRRYKNSTKNGKIYFVDVFYPGEYYRITKKIIIFFCTIISKLFVIIKISRWRRKAFDKGALKTIFQSAIWYYCYKNLFSDEILKKGEFITHNMPNIGTEQLFDHAKNLLMKYSEAGLVITSRLHCALPCLGLETPIVFIKPDGTDHRLAGLLEMFRYYEFNDGIPVTDDDLLKKTGKITTKHNITNKNNYIKYKIELERRCNEFTGISADPV